jgi:hypothetical protein
MHKLHEILILNPELNQYYFILVMKTHEFDLLGRRTIMKNGPQIECENVGRIHLV